MIELFKKIINKIIRPQNPFEYNVDKMKAYLESFAEPKDDIDRSYLQYKCQMKQSGFIAKVILNVIAGVLLPICFLFSKKIVFDGKCQYTKAVFYSNGLDYNILPEVLKKEYSEIVITNNEKMFTIDDDIKVLIGSIIKRYPFSFYLSLKCLIKLSIYCNIIRTKKCGSIISSCEYSFTSSMLTYYCCQKGIKHINIMHGEKLFNIRDAFFHFHEFYIWDEFYEKLFMDLRANADFYFIDIPSFYYLKKDFLNNKRIDYKYFLQAEDIKALERINSELMCLRESGFTVKVRPHPLYTDIGIVNSAFKQIDIENPNCVNIEESIMESKNVISLYSTVLFQAYLNNVEVVIDDITSKEHFMELRKLKYYMLEKNVTLLSSIIDNVSK